MSRKKLAGYNRLLARFAVRTHGEVQINLVTEEIYVLIRL